MTRTYLMPNPDNPAEVLRVKVTFTEVGGGRTEMHMVMDLLVNGQLIDWQPSDDEAAALLQHILGTINEEASRLGLKAVGGYAEVVPTEGV